MKKTCLIVNFLLICFCLSAQDKHYVDGSGFNSFFQKQKEGTFKGSTSGLLRFKHLNGDVSIAAFSKTDTKLELVPDTNEIYDVSYKKYMTHNSKVNIEYVTYNDANSLKLKIKDQTFQISLIDGACLGIIRGLEYEYVSADEKELLILHFSEDVGLCSSDCYTTPNFFILKGSTLIFKILKDKSLALAEEN